VHYNISRFCRLKIGSNLKQWKCEMQNWTWVLWYIAWEMVLIKIWLGSGIKTCLFMIPTGFLQSVEKRQCVWRRPQWDQVCLNTWQTKEAWWFRPWAFNCNNLASKMKLDNLQYDNSTVTMCMIDKIETSYPQNQNVGSILHLVWNTLFHPFWKTARSHSPQTGWQDRSKLKDLKEYLCL